LVQAHRDGVAPIRSAFSRGGGVTGDGRYPTYGPHGLGELKSWQVRPDNPLAFIQKKWEAPSEVLVNDGR
jgi:hypothetical protein